MTQSENASGTPPLWINSRNYDLGFYILSGVASLFLLIPYIIWKEASIWPIYSFYLIFFGLPHNFLTWATLLPPEARKTFRLEPIVTAAIICAIICLLIPPTKGSAFGDWILSFIAYYSLWHAYRQHYGICKIYDSIQSKRTKDASIFSDRKWLNISFGLSAFGIIVWAFTHERVDYLLSPDDKHELIHPVLPLWFFHAYLAAMAFTGVMGIYHTLIKRRMQGKFIPWPQLALISVSLAVYYVPYLFLDLSAIPVPVAIGTIFHNIQYFGFVWAFERERTQQFNNKGTPLSLPLRLVFQGSWKTYGSMALAYSFLVIGAYLALPKLYGLAFIYFIGIAHYIIDGYVWRRDINGTLPGVMDRWATSFNLTFEKSTRA